MARRTTRIELDRGEFSTLSLLAQKFDSRPFIPLKEVHDIYFSHLSFAMFYRKISNGDIRLLVSRIEPSQKALRFVHLHDLAAYLEGCQDGARSVAA